MMPKTVLCKDLILKYATREKESSGRLDYNTCSQ